jgi:hypothetical protein
LDSISSGGVSRLYFDSCFYLDSPASARRNGMPTRSKHEADITHRSLRHAGCYLITG